MFGLITSLLTITTSTLMAMNLLQSGRTSTKSASATAASNSLRNQFDQAYYKAKDVPGAEISVTEPYTYQDGFKTKTGYITQEDEVM